MLSLRNFITLTTHTGLVSMRQAVAQFWVSPSFVQAISTSAISVRSWLVQYIPVQAALQAFRDSSEVGVWTNINKNSLLEDIRNTVVNPLNIRQTGTPFCGPASVVFELASRQKTKYVKFCQELLETGQFNAQRQVIQASKNTMESSVPKKISVADWMMLATLRDSENILIPVDDEWVDFAEGITGITFPSELETWIYEVLGFNSFGFYPCYTSDELAALITANNVWQENGVAFLLIDLNLLKDRDDGLIPNHWVSFQNGFSAVDADQGTSVVFNCYSWGKIFTVAMQENELEDYLFGVVFGKP